MLLKEYEKLSSIHYKILGMSWAGWVFDYYDLMLFSFILIPLSLELGLTAIQSSLIMGFSLLATAVGGVIFGRLADKYGRKTILQWTIIIYSVGAFLGAFAWSVESLLIIRFITGLGVGGEWATAQTYISECFPSHMRGKYAGWVQTGAPIGVILAAIVGGFLQPIFGWRVCFLISVIPALIVIYIRKALPESDLWLKNNNVKKDNGFKALFSKNYRKMFIYSLILCTLAMSAYWFTYTWLPSYLQVDKNISLVGSSLWIIVIQTGAFLGYFSFGYVSDCIGRRPTFSIYAILMAIGVTMITVCWDLIIQNNLVILLFMFIVGFGTGFFSGLGPIISESFPTEIRNTALGSSFNLARGIQFVTPLIIAIMSLNNQFTFGIFLAAIFALGIAIWVWVFPETKGKVVV